LVAHQLVGAGGERVALIFLDRRQGRRSSDVVHAGGRSERATLNERLLPPHQPGSTECISYQMPALRHDKVFLYFAAFKKHIGVYPPVQDQALAEELARYRGPKGNLQFPLSAPLPYDLIARVAQSLARQYSSTSN
jgi:uncharacterized protein YdhG (YjbR/CyaY superfamily)